jgi:hypothetical protein
LKQSLKMFHRGKRRSSDLCYHKKTNGKHNM